MNEVEKNGVYVLVESSRRRGLVSGMAEPIVTDFVSSIDRWFSLVDG